jgi:6-phosphogluconolactonase
MAAKAVGRVGRVTVISTSTAVETAAAMVSEALFAPGSRRRLGVAGGSVMKAIGLIRSMLGSSRWPQVLLTWVDERLVPEASNDSNRGAAYLAAALSTDDPPRVELPLVRDGEDGEAAVRRVTLRFTNDFSGALDVALLGIGEDGHVASLFPSHRLVSEVTADFAWLDDSPKLPPGRVTMTRKVLAQPGLTRFVLATGASKRDALEAVVRGDSTSPLTLLGPITVITDQHLTK